jgi:hypothetical protein
VNIAVNSSQSSLFTSSPTPTQSQQQQQQSLFMQHLWLQPAMQRLLNGHSGSSPQQLTNGQQQQLQHQLLAQQLQVRNYCELKSNRELPWAIM